MMKSFRKSKRLSGSPLSQKPSISHIGVRDASLPDPSLQLPRRVIKALYDYSAQGPGELSFLKGDFFHLFSDPADSLADELDGWFEATNPITNSKGMVPVSYFEVFGRSRPAVSDATADLPVSASTTSGSPSRPNSLGRARTSTGPGQLLYAVALFEFKAERSDELDIEPGENLTICAHHQHEWFIAKPINRLGGPGLIPLTYVKIIDSLKPNDPQHNVDLLQDLGPDAVRRLIDYLNIPTVENWKDQTAKYQALTIPLGSISNSAHQNPQLPHSQFFEGVSNGPLGANGPLSGANGNNNGHSMLPTSFSLHNGLPRASLLTSNVAILEAGVDSYQLDHGRYQYLVVARLSNGLTRYLFRYYQDFYDLQVKLLDVFPHEAGKIDNTKRTIPVIPGPLINVNDNISKLRREKLDLYLRNLIAMPHHISRSEQVLLLFDVLDNGFDREFVEDDGDNNAKSNSHQPQRTLKPISQKSNSQQDRMSQYSYARNSQGNNPYEQGGLAGSRHNSFLHSSSNVQNQQLAAAGTAASGPADKLPAKFKVKFYYMDDIFVLLLPANLKLQDLKSRLYKRLGPGEGGAAADWSIDGPDGIRLFLKNDYDEFVEENGITSDADYNTHLREVLKEFEVDDDEKFHTVLMDKVRLVILA